MMEMPIRTGRRFQDAAIRVREGITERKDLRQQQNSLHRQRMTCASSLRNVSQTQDWTDGMNISPSGRFQIVEQAKPHTRIISREGIRWDVAWIVLAAVTVLCIATLLADLAGIGIGSRSISRLQARIEDYTRKNDVLKAEWTASTGDTKIVTRAVDYHLIAGSAAPTIRLTLPEELSTNAITAETRNNGSGKSNTY